jgi:hypothetical protein
MTPTIFDLPGIVNVEQTLQFVWRNGTAAAPGVPIDLTGYSARFVVAKAPSATATIERSTANGGITLGAATGVIVVSIPRAAMAIAPGEYHYYLILTASGGRDYPLLTGRFSVSPKTVPVAA